MLPANYLDRAVSTLRKLGIEVQPENGAPVVAILDKIAHYDNVKVISIAATLQQSSSFNAAVREQIAGMDISTRYADIAERFNSIRDDTRQMVEWTADGKLDFGERMRMNWMTMRRGSIPDRFNDIRREYHQVAESANDQIQRENAILEAYRDFRMALKEAEVQAQELLNIASAALDQKKYALQEASSAVASYGGPDAAERARLELVRDEALRTVQNEDHAYQVVKDVADDLKTAYNTAELVFARLQQTHSVKERLYQRAVTFFSTNEVVFTGLSASFTSMAGLSEATNTMEAMKTGMNKGLEDLARTGGAQLEAGLRAGYGSTLQTSSVKALADAVVEFQASTIKLVDELRKESTQTAREIEAAAEDGKRRFVELVARGA